MAGRIDHLSDEDGKFTMDLIENMGDAHEALEECYTVINKLQHLAIEKGLDMKGCSDIA